jgi:hypothetical protein
MNVNGAGCIGELKIARIHYEAKSNLLLTPFSLDPLGTVLILQGF